MRSQVEIVAFRPNFALSVTSAGVWRYKSLPRLWNRMGFAQNILMAPAFTETESRLIRRSFARLIPVSDRLSEDFYNLLFERHPDVRPLFPVDMASQNEKFILMIANLVDAMDDPSLLESRVNAMGVSHVGYGAQREHFGAVGEALVDTLKHEALALTDEELQAWIKLYSVIADGMMAVSK